MGVSAISFTNGEDTDKASHRIMKKILYNYKLLAFNHMASHATQ